MRFLGLLLLLSEVLHAAPVSPERYGHLARGVNLTRWFQYGSYIPINEGDRDQLQQAGFNAVRIAVAPQYLLPKWATPAVIQENLTRLDHGIDMFIHSGMSVTLDFQADAEYLDYYLAEPGAAAKELIETWRRLATRYADRDPEYLFFEIMNEPDARFSQADWDAVQREALAVIHQIAPRHTVLLAPVNWSGLDGLVQMTPYEDPNVIYVLHYYSPSTFTHQGANWTGQPGLENLRGVPWPAWMPAPEQTNPDAAQRLTAYQAEDWDRSHIEWDMHLAAEWAREWNVSVIVNEFGAYKPFASPDSRVRWLHDMRIALEQEHLAWAVWDYAAGFDVTEEKGGVRQIDPVVRAALGLSPWDLPEPARIRPDFTGPLEVQIGAGTPIVGPPFGINAESPLVVVTSLEENPVQLFRKDGQGLLHATKFDGPAPVTGAAPIVPGHFVRSNQPGYFFPGPVSKLALPFGETLKESTLPPVSATAAAAGDVNRDGVDDVVLFGQQLKLLRNDGAGHFTLVPNAFPIGTEGFHCGVIVNGNLLAFGPGVARTFVGNHKDKFKAGKALPASEGQGDCTVVAAGGEVVVAWTNDTIDVLSPNGKKSNIPLPPSKHGIRNIAYNAAILTVTRPGEPPLVFQRHRDGTFVPLDNLKPANNLSIAAATDLNGDGLVDFVYAQGGNAPLLARFLTNSAILVLPNDRPAVAQRRPRKSPHLSESAPAGSY